MTVVVGFNWLSEVVVIADSRVSWQNNTHPPKDILRKLYPISLSNKSAVLGFCGDVQAAKLVMCFLWGNKLQNYKRPLVLPQFKDELRGWIEKAARDHLTARQRTGLQFMLCGIEPSRHPLVEKDGHIVGHISSFHEAHINVYSIKADGTVISSNKNKGQKKDMMS